MKSVVDLRKEYFKLQAAMDIRDTEADLKVIEVSLKKIKLRLKTFLHKLNIKFQVNNFNSVKEQGKINFERSFKTLTDVKLPKLSLPTFYGNIYEWITFSDLFKAAVHSNKNLFNGQKLQYLLLALKNDAFKAVK